MHQIERFGVSMSRQLLRRFDARIAAKGYANRSEAIRDMVRDYLVANEWEDGDEPVMGTVTLVYDHHAHHLAEALTELQHQHHEAIVCATHVHLDHDNCLEVIVVKGPSDKVRAIADRLIGTKGVKHGKLVSTTTGRKLT